MTQSSMGPSAHSSGDARWTALFDRIAFFLTLLGFLLRVGVDNANAGVGFNLFIHLMFWIALTLWFAGRALSSGGAYRFTGLEYPFLAFVAFSLVSVLRASFKLPALDHAFTFLSLMLFFILCVQVLGRRQLLFALLATLVTLSVYALVQRFVLFPQLQDAAKATESVELARRIRTNEVFATLGGPNQFAGFLVLLLPIVVGSMLDSREFRLRGAALALGVAALWLTGSLGGGVAAACGAATMGVLAFTRSRGRTIAVSAGAGAAVIAAGLLLWSPLLSAMASRSHSMHVRSVYWKATGPIVSHAPVLGVGLDNWQEHYYRTKSDVQQETNKAHNDYLQILAETGLPGFLAFAALLAFGLRKALARESAPAPEPEPPSPWLAAGVSAVLLLLGLALAGDLIGRAISIILAILWFGVWLLLNRTSRSTETAWTRMGAAGGFVALLVHMMVDFQIYQFGVAAALVAVLALVAMLRDGGVEVRLPKGVCMAAAAVLMAVSVPLLTVVDPRALAAGNETHDAKTALLAFQRNVSSNPTLLLAEAIQVAESAQKHNPFSPEAYQLYYQAKQHERDLLLQVGAKDTRDVEILEGVAIQALENALQLRPNSSPLHQEKSAAHLGFRRYHLKSGKDSGMARAKAAEHLRLAVEHQRRAYDLYPTFSRNAYWLARVLEFARDADAPRYYKEALRLSDLAGKELENLDRLKLDPLAQARALRSQGRAMDAHDLLDRHLRDAIKNLPAATARRGLERYVKMSEDEMDEGMTPVIKDIVDAIMRDLK